MKIDHKKYAEDLVTINGKAKAIEMMQEGFLTSQSNGSSLTLFDEADFAVSDYGKHEYSKTQSKKTANVKPKRIKGNINFYRHILILLGVKGLK